MSSFNWFNRQFDESSTAKADEAAEAKPAEEAKSDASPEAPAVSEDYLNWAKAAYQNIQKRKQAEVAPESPAAADAATTAPEPPAPEPVVESVPDAVTESVPDAAAEAVPDAAAEAVPDAAAESAPDAATESATESATEPAAEPAPGSQTESAVLESAPAVEAIAPPSEPAAPAETETPTPVTALPFWAQAEAERQERLERLSAEAIVDEPAPVAESDSTASEPEEPLDENFIWSAGVLAAQGRRPDQVDLEEITWLKRLRQGLDKTRRSLINQLRSIVGQGPLNQDAVSEIESLLLQADVGVEATDYIIESLQAKLLQEVLPPEQAIAYLKQLLREMLDRPYQTYNATFAPDRDSLNIWLITGVNGAGKTTTIGKLAHVASKSGYKCLIGAADTFRAAAVEQVKVWGQRSNVDVIANPGQNTDPAAVVFDAIAAAQSRGTELLLLDTAGRLQNKKNLMDELSKIRRIIDKKAPGAKIESLLVLDSTLGQNGLRQAQVFSEAAQLSGVVLTKLDGTAKGGIALAVVQQLGLPIRFIGAGEGIEDLRPFSSYEFVEALLSG